VAPIKAYFDKPTQKEIQPVTTMQIYWGAVPYVIIQIIMVGLIIAFPEIVSSGLDKEEGLSAEQVQLEMMNATQDDAAGYAAPEPGAEATQTPEEDPMKMMQESMEKDSTSK
jgi:GntP family gluconate:H+ symporter